MSRRKEGERDRERGEGKLKSCEKEAKGDGGGGEVAETTIRNVYALYNTRKMFELYSTTHVYVLSVHGPRWYADSLDTVVQSELLPMQSLAVAMEPSGWIM